MAERRVNEERLFNAIDALNAKGLVILDKEGNEISLIVNKIDAEGNALGFEVLREAFISTIEKIPNDREKELGSKEDLIPSTFNDIIDDLDDEKKAKAKAPKKPKAPKAPKTAQTPEGGTTEGTQPAAPKPPRQPAQKSEFGHLLGTQAAAIDKALIEGGGTAQEIADKAQSTLPVVKGHISYLKRTKGVNIVNENGVYKIAPKDEGQKAPEGEVQSEPEKKDAPTEGSETAE